MNDEEIAKKWKEDVCSNDELDFTPKMVDWCIAELRYIASFHAASPENPPPIVVFNGDVVKSDTAVSTELKNALQEAVNKFQAAIPQKLKDWHPGSPQRLIVILMGVVVLCNKEERVTQFGHFRVYIRICRHQQHRTMIKDL